MILKRKTGNAKNAFTLAEVLIALAIIGIVAAVTMPSLVQKYKERVIVTSLKKFYATFSQAFNLAIISEGYEFTSKDVIKYLKTEKVCEQTSEGCTSKYRPQVSGSGYLQFGPNDSWVTYVDYVVLANGAILRMSRNVNLNSSSGSYGEIAVDINGDVGPNIAGHDTFYFYLTPKGVLPFGHVGDTTNYFSKCANKSGLGYECTAWVIENGNMDYLRCNDLSWDGKHKCSD